MAELLTMVEQVWEKVERYLYLLMLPVSPKTATFFRGRRLGNLISWDWSCVC